MPQNCQAGTEALDLVERLASRIRYGRLWTTIGTAIIMAIGAAVGTWISNAPAAKAESVAVRVATEVARSEVVKAQKSTEAISYEASARGSKDALAEFWASLPTAPVGKQKVISKPLVVEP